MNDSVFKALMLLIALTAFGVAAAIGAAGPGTRLGFWEYGTGLSIIRNMAFPSIIAAILAILSFIVSLFKARNLTPIMFLAATAVTCSAIVPIMFDQRVTTNPFIHDITTDFENPPKIVAASDLPRKNPVTYKGSDPAPNSDITVAEAQRYAFPDIQPIIVSMKISEAARTSRRIIDAMKMEILRENTSDEDVTIEATYTSFWFGFIDDFIVRLRHENGKTRIDVRSQSRVGVSDLGANANRVREFISKFNKEVGSR